MAHGLEIPSATHTSSVFYWEYPFHQILSIALMGLVGYAFYKLFLLTTNHATL